MINQIALKHFRKMEWTDKELILPDLNSYYW